MSQEFLRAFCFFLQIQKKLKSSFKPFSSISIVLAIIFAGLFCSACTFNNKAETNYKGQITVLQINDVYVASPINKGTTGGLSRVKTLKDKIKSQNPNTLLLLPGDFISPSVASSVFKGEQMVAALNSAGVDIATLGNHEFDFGIDVLVKRMKEAKWTWVVSNVIDLQTQKPIGGAKPYLIKNYDGLKVGFIGLCLNGDEIAKEDLKGKNTSVEIIDPLEAAEKYIKVLKKEKVDLIIALTHQRLEDDKQLAEEFPDIDLVVGGHEHFPIKETINKTLISKAGSNAKFVARIDLQIPSTLMLPLSRGLGGYKLIKIDESIERNPEVEEAIKKYEEQLNKKLDVIIGDTNQPLDGIAEDVRSKQTNLGTLITKAMAKATSSDIALLNGGAIRGDKKFGPGPISKKDIVTMHPFDDVVIQVEMTGSEIIEALNHGVEKVEEKLGRYPQTYGVSFDIEMVDKKENEQENSEKGSKKEIVKNVKVKAGSNWTEIELEKKYKVAITNYLFEGGDGYFMFANKKVLISEDQGKLLVSIIEGGFKD